MNGRPARTQVLCCFICLAILAGARGAAAQVAREQVTLRVTAVDAAGFPTVRVRVLAAGPGSAPPADVSRLLLRENGVPIADTTLTRAPVGANVVLVIDANNDFLAADDASGITRLDKVAQSIGHLAESLSPDGLDHVSIIAPDPTRQAFVYLAQDATQPAELNAALAAYDPAPPADAPLRATPLQEMLAAAIDHLAATPDGRFQAVLLYTDGARLDRQLDAVAIVQAAQAAGLPLFVAILGAEASPEELANAARLTGPTNGQTVHMPTPEAADPLYALFAAQSEQTELVYRSALRESGPQQVAVSLGNVQATASFDLTLAAPQVVMEVAQTTVRRVGSAPDTPLGLLQPAVMPLAARLVWPATQTRQLTEVTFLVDGVAQPLAAMPTADAGGRLSLAWDISERDAGSYELSLAVTDELGFQATAEPVSVIIEVARPSPPTPTTAPTAAPAPAQAAAGQLSWLLPGAILALAGGTLLWAMRRARRPAVAPPPPATPPPPPAPPAGHVPILEWRSAAGAAEQIELLAGNVTLGRDAGAVDIVLDDPSVSRLHARIRRRDDAYWLYDEGSIMGTFLNHERLGLAPQPLRHGDTVDIGHVTLTFRLELARPGTPPEPPAPDDPPPGEEET